MSIFWETVVATMVGIGGGGVIVGGLAVVLGKIWVSRITENIKASLAQDLERIRAKYTNDLEVHKIRLKKSELMFARQYEAYSAFFESMHSILPRYAYPDMDWYDACDQVARLFTNHEECLDAFLVKHSPALPPNIRSIIASARIIAETNKFELDDPMEIPSSVNAAANSFLEKLQEADGLMLSLLHDQIESGSKGSNTLGKA